MRDAMRTRRLMTVAQQLRRTLSELRNLAAPAQEPGLDQRVSELEQALDELTTYLRK